MRTLLLSIILFFCLSARSQTLNEVNDSLLHYYKSRQYERAIPFAEKAVVLIKEKYGAEHGFYAQYLNLLAGLYVSAGLFTKAEQVLLQMNGVNKKLSGENSKDYIDGISMLAVVYSTMGESRKSVPFFIEAMDHYRRTAGDTSAAFAVAANRLAKVYEELGDYEKAAPILSRSLEILALSKGINDLSYATSMNNLGIVYKNMGHPEKAEPLLLQAMAIRKKMAGEDSDDYANSLNNLAVLYSSLGQHRKAENYYSLATGIFKKTKGPSSAEYITSLTNLGAEYDMLGEYDKAEEILLTASGIAEKKYEEGSPLRMTIIKDLGQLYLAMGQYNKAEPLLLKVADNEKRKSEVSETYAAALNDLAYLYTHTNRIEEAEKIYVRSADLTRSALGNLHTAYATTLNNLAVLYQRTRRYAEAMRLLSEVNQVKEFNLLNLFAILSEEEKANYMATNVFLQQTNLSLLYNYPAAGASFYKENFNIQLLVKSLLLTDTKNVLDAIRASKDGLMRSRLDQWQANKKILAKEYSLPGPKRRTDLRQLENETEDLEKELVRLSAGFRNMRAGIGIKMEDVQKQLGDDEAVIEFVSFGLVNREITDSVVYAAFVLKKNDAAPSFIPLFEEKQLLKLAGVAGKTSKVFINNLYPGNNNDTLSVSHQLYRLIWQPLEPYLQGIKKISWSPAGRLHNIALHALPPGRGSLLMDHYQLDQYTSTKDLLLRDTASSYKKPMSASLFGNPQFSLDSATLVQLKKEGSYKEKISTSIFIPDNKDMINTWPSLQGTEKEITAVKKLFDKNKIPAPVYSGLTATEENLKNLSGRSAQALFIATHGFFLPARKNIKNNTVTYGSDVLATSVDPLLRSGLILSGGNYVWSGKAPLEGVEDGIVTAYEISQLDLGNTELVVLSACESGLGDIKGAEGVFGLQRAFKMAGAKKMIVSLWKVPDKETAELITAFYTYWLNGKTIAAAFQQARTDMRRKYAPYYWAAFVLIE